MSHPTRLLLIASLLGLPACPAAAQQQQAQPETVSPEAQTGAGRCVNLRSIRSTKVLDDQTILFDMNGNQTLVNRLPRRCPGLRFEKRFAYKTSLSQLCSTDIITVITDHGRGASCGLGEFTVWVPPEEVAPAGAEGKLVPVETPAEK